MNFSGNGNAQRPGGPIGQSIAGHQANASTLQLTSQSSSSSSSSLPSVGTPSRFNSAGPAFSLFDLPVDALFHTSGFLGTIDLIRLGGTCKALYSVTGDLQRSVSAVHWRGGASRRADEQRDLTRRICDRAKIERNKQLREIEMSMAASSPETLQKRRLIESQAVIDIKAQASSVGSRFRHVSFSMSNDALEAEIGEALANAHGWNHLNLSVSDIRPLPGFLRRLRTIEEAKRSASPAGEKQRVRQLSIQFDEFSKVLSEPVVRDIMDALRALEAEACGMRIVDLNLPPNLPPEILQHFLKFVEDSLHIEQLSAYVDWDAAPLLDALRASASPLKSLTLRFSNVSSNRTEFGCHFDGSSAWQLDRLAIYASSLKVSRLPVAFLASCNIREIQLHGLEFDSTPEASGALGAALAQNTAVESLAIANGSFDYYGGNECLLRSLQASTSLKCLTLGKLTGFHFYTLETIDCIKRIKSLSEIHIVNENRAKYREELYLQLARSQLRIFLNEELLELQAGVEALNISTESDSDDGYSSDSDSADPADGDYARAHSSADPTDSDDSSDRSENDSSDERDLMADIGRLIQRAKDAEKQ
ncbi:MAG: hypothetical protein Q7T64_02390 [Lacisediminimonas sp.]|nr:hypothetical protein [Lacisediminimonas sp.]